MITARAFSGKRYCVLGLARSGMAAVESLLESGAEVTAWDTNEQPRRVLEGDTYSGRVTLADPLDIDLAGFDAIVVSPGVPLNTHPIAAKAREADVPLIGDVELFALARPELPAHRVIGITGTNGKSTTTALTAHLLENAQIPASMGGNIGLPILAQDPLPIGGVYVLELSSYQIDLTFSLDCDAAALLNITPDHLDRYDGFEAYAQAKARLFAMQGAQGLAVFGCSDAATSAVQKKEDARRGSGGSICVDTDKLAHAQEHWPSLQGPHNLQNAAIAVELVGAMGLDQECILPGLRSFTGLVHRMERIGPYRDILFISDSKATNPASTAPALAAYQNIHWICGGLAKEDNLDECAPHFGNILRAYTIGDAAQLFAGLLDGEVPVENCETLDAAVRRALENAKAGEVIMLSPACASFDQFRDFEERGESFRQLVEELAHGDAG